MRRVSASTRKWLETRGHVSDRERARLTADKCRFWIAAWEAVKARKGQWMTTADLMLATGATNKTCRRMILRLAATGLCELQEPRPSMAYEIRLKKEPQ